jgi:hypothetical protein
MKVSTLQKLNLFRGIGKKIQVEMFKYELNCKFSIEK